MTSLSDFTALDIKGHRTPLSAHAGKVVLIVNTASKCAFTSQYKGLQTLQEKYAAQGFTVLGFPCNQFLHQEPGTDETIAAFCTEQKVTFPMFAKVDVNGAGADPLYAWLKKAAPGALGSEAIKWNFTKFLLDTTGKPVVRFAPTMEPGNIAPSIERMLRNR